jgi:predicted dehydrogenase
MTFGIGVIGCGMVSHAYLGTIARADGLRLKALASRTMASAERQAANYGGEAISVDAMLADPEISVVVNLAPPAVHHMLGRRILEAGKHLYSEKPFAIALDDAYDLIALAETKGLSIACAPDTFLGEGHQATRRLVDSGAIGTINGGAMAFGTRGMESWHPDPGFFYANGGGPLLDVGPYYITQLVNLLGPVAEVAAIGTTPRTVRTISSPRRSGEQIDVAVPTSVTGSLLFASGANVSLAMSWDVRAHLRRPIELYGSLGSIEAPDPNQFGGEPRISLDGLWPPRDRVAPAMDDTTIATAIDKLVGGIDPITGGPAGPETMLRLGDRRGLGLVEQVASIGADRKPRCSAYLAVHVLETLLALERSAWGEGRIAITSRVDRPDPLEVRS